MAHRIPHCIALVATLLLLACGGADTQQALLLDEIAMQMNTAPDSALARLDSMDAETLPRHQRMRWELLRGNCLNKTDVPFTTDSLMLRVADYFDHHGTPNQRLLAHYVLGCTYRDMGDAPRTLECYHDAVAQVDTADTGCDIHQLGLVYSQIADVFDIRHLTKQALQAYAMAEYCAQRENNIPRLLNVMENRADVTLYNGQTDEALAIKQQVAAIHESMGNKDLAARTKFACIVPLVEKGEFDKALEMIQYYERHSGFFLPNGDVLKGKEGFYYVKGTYFLKSGQLDSAEHYFRKEIEKATEKTKIKQACNSICKTFNLSNQPDSVAKYAIYYLSLVNPAYSSATAESLQKIQAEYDYSQHRLRAILAEKVAAQRKSLILLTTLIIILLGAVTLSIYLRTRHKKQMMQMKLERLHLEKTRIEQELEERTAEKTVLEQQISEHQTLESMLSDMEKHKESLAQLNRINNQNLACLKEKDETILSLQQQLGTLTKQIDVLHKYDKVELLSGNSLISKFNDLAYHRKTPTEEEWLELEKLASTMFPYFYAATHQNKPLKDVEYRICILTKLQFKVGDICALLDLSPSNVTNKRVRMLPKIFNVEGNAADFDRRIRNIDHFDAL